MHTDLEKLTRAREWLDAAANKWRLQTLQLRGRYNQKTGEYRNLPTKIRRFLNGTPVGIITDTLELLRSQAPYSEPIFNFENGGETRYRPVSTYITKDGTQNASNLKDATYTIVQDLRVVDDVDDEFDCDDQVSCSAVSSSRYVWDVTDIEDLPEAEQGVIYRITGVGRSEETDLLHYQVSKIVAKTQHALPFVSKSDERSVTTVETWDNVYGTTDEPKWDTGEAITVPSSSKGVTVEVSFQENADCTYKLVVSTTKAKEQGDTYSAYHDRYKSQTNERTFNAESPLAKAGVEYSGGKMTKCTSERNPDGTYNTSVDVETERTVEKSVQELRVTTRGIVKTITDANVSTGSLTVPKYGSVKITKTPGGLLTVERTEFERNLVDRLSVACSDTAFVHVHEKTKGVEAAEDAHVDPAEGGLVKSVTYQTDESGNVTLSEKTQQEHTVKSAERTVTMTPRGLVTSTTHRSMDPAEAEALFEALGTFDAARIGSGVTVRTTDGNMCDVIEQAVARQIGVGLSRLCSTTVFQHTDRSVVTADAMGEDHATAGGGKTGQIEYELDASTGSVTKTTTETTETAVQNAETETVVTPRYTRKSVTHRNQNAALADPTAPGNSVHNRTTDGGSHDVTTVTVTAKSGAGIGSSCEKSELMHSDTTTTVAAALGTAHAQSSPGHVESITEEVDENGVVTSRKTTTDYSEKSVETVSANRKLRKETTVSFRNAASVPSPGDNGGVSAHVNENGTYDGQHTEVVVTADEKTFKSLDRKLRKEQTTVFHNAAAPKDAGEGGSASANETDEQIFSGQSTTVTLTADEKQFKSLNRKLRKETTTIFHNNSAPKDAGEGGSASASESDDQVFGGQSTEVTLEPDEKTFKSLNRKLRKETTTIFHNNSAPKDAGEGGSASASESDDQVFGGQSTEVTLTADSKSFTSEDNALVTKTTTVFHNNTSPMNAGAYGSASASETDDQVFSGQSTAESPKGLVFDYGPYTSTETSPYGKGTITITKTVKGKVFVNQSSIPSVSGSGKGQVSVSCSASINKYGLVDGKIEITETSKVWDDGSSSGGTEKKNIIGKAYKITETRVTPIGLGVDDEKPIVLVETIETTHQIGLNCENLPGTMLAGSAVTMTKSGLYNYHAVTAVAVKKSVVKHGDGVTA